MLTGILLIRELGWFDYDVLERWADNWTITYKRAGLVTGLLLTRELGR